MPYNVEVSIYSFNKKNDLDIERKEFKKWMFAVRYVNTYKPKRNYKIEKVLIERVETLV